MKVRVSPEAEEEIYEIGRFVARDDRMSALRLIDELWDRCEALADAPEKGPIVGKVVGSLSASSSTAPISSCIPFIPASSAFIGWRTAPAIRVSS